MGEGDRRWSELDIFLRRMLSDPDRDQTEIVLMSTTYAKFCMLDFWDFSFAQVFEGFCPCSSELVSKISQDQHA